MEKGDFVASQLTHASNRAFQTLFCAGSPQSGWAHQHMTHTHKQQQLGVSDGVRGGAIIVMGLSRFCSACQLDNKIK